MEFESPDVEKDFPGLYTSGEKSKKTKDESDYSEGDHDKLNKKDLLSRRKEKKDRGYAALEGESSPEDFDANLSKVKKSKTFKFSSSKTKEKREKSREKDKLEKDGREEDKTREREKPDKEKRKDKDKKEKEKKEKYKEKDKEKKDKKIKQSSSITEDVPELGDVQPVFGVPVNLATERSRCHDGITIPLVLRDCIDYLQENSLSNEQIYKVEPIKTRLQHFKRLYNNREESETDELDTPTSCGLLKLFLRELPEPLLTTELIERFEEAASHTQITKQEEELRQLIDQLPKYNKTILSWILLHFDAILKNEKLNKMNVQSLATLLGPPLQMSHRLLVALICHCSNLFADVELIRYVPPITASSPKLPENPNDIQIELRKQESLLSQIHSEMNAGFVSKRREEQLWEVQRIITQLKRKLRSFEKKQDKTAEILTGDATTTATTSPTEIKNVQQPEAIDNTSSNTIQVNKLSCSDDDSVKTNELSLTTTTVTTTTTTTTTIMTTTTTAAAAATEVIATTHLAEPPPLKLKDENEDDITKNNNNNEIPNDNTKDDITDLYIDEDIGLLMLPKSHPEYKNLLRAQLEYQELLNWKEQLQSRISCERAEVFQCKQLYQKHLASSANTSALATTPGETNIPEVDYEKIVENYTRENALLEHKKNILAKEIFEERRGLISLQVELALSKF